MRYTFDQGNGLLYVYFAEEPVSEQMELPDGSVADVSAAGRLVGLEVINLTEWRPELAVKTFDLSKAEEDVLIGLRDGLAPPALMLSTGQLIGA